MMRGRRSVHRMQGLIDLVLANSTDEVGAERKSDRHFEKLNDQFCSGHFDGGGSTHGRRQEPTPAIALRLLHSITSSARASTVAGISRPIASAVLRFPLPVSYAFGSVIAGRPIYVRFH